MSKSWKVVLVALPCILAPLGCVPSEAARYSNDVAGITRDLQAAGKQFGDKLQSNVGNPARAQELYDETAKSADSIIKRGRALAPPKTAEGKALHEALLSFLETEDQIIHGDFADIARYVGMNRVSAIMPIINAANQQEKAKVEKLKAAQQTFAKANKIILIY
jgi:hypothetical protein